MGYADVIVVEPERHFIIPGGANSTIVQSENCGVDVSRYYALTFFVRVKLANAASLPTGNNSYTAYAQSISNNGFSVRFALAGPRVVLDESLVSGSRWVDLGVSIGITNPNNIAYGATFSASATVSTPGASLVWYMVNADAAVQSFIGDIYLVGRGY